MPEVKHREALEDLFSKDELFSYEELVKKLKESYAKAGYSFGINKAKDLKVFLEKNLMIKKQGKSYGYNPDFKY